MLRRREAGTCAATGVRHPHCLKRWPGPRVVADACVKRAPGDPVLQPGPRLIQDPTPRRFTGAAPGLHGPSPSSLVLKDLSGLLKASPGLTPAFWLQVPCFISLQERVGPAGSPAGHGGPGPGQEHWAGGQGSRRARRVACLPPASVGRWVGQMCLELLPLGPSLPCRAGALLELGPPGGTGACPSRALRSVLGSAVPSACAPGLCSVRGGDLRLGFARSTTESITCLESQDTQTHGEAKASGMVLLPIASYKIVPVTEFSA